MWNKWFHRLAPPKQILFLNSLVLSGLLCLTGINALLCWKYVDFSPQLSSKFFFSSEDSQLQSEKAIAEEFGSQDQLILSCRGDVDSESYFARVESLTDALEAIPGVFRVFSLSEGPKSLNYAKQSPLWQRILLPKEGEGSNIIVFVQGESVDDLMPDISKDLILSVQQAAKEHQTQGFDIVISGMPYIVDQMRVALTRDFKVFSIVAAIVFALLILILMRSIRMVFGMFLACVNAGALTLLITQMMEIPLSLLTANLTTIVFTLTLSHTVFLTFNWHRVQDKENPVSLAVKRTISPSFWSMLTTLLGFMSLLFVKAEPLRKLGVSGAIGTVVAFVIAYLFHPGILWLSRNAKKKAIGQERISRLKRILLKPHALFSGVVVLVVCASGFGVVQLERDPSLLAYFAKDTALRDGLEYVDEHLGSSPLNIVVRLKDQQKLDNQKAYQALWELQQAFEADETVGSVVSLPVIMAEAKKVSFIGAILPWNWLVELMETSMAQNVASYFINEDRSEGLFTLLMHEEKRNEPRESVIKRLEQNVLDKGFEPYQVGGVYVLQGRLTKMVMSSLINGILLLFLFIGVIVIVLTRSWRLTLALLISVAMIPLWMLGIIGYFKIPFDVISAPAVNLAVSMGVDAMIHLVSALRFEQAKGPIPWRCWVNARLQLFKPVVFSTIVVSAGFGVFTLSAFPPTQRFGGSIVLGMLMVPVVALLIMPLIAELLLNRKLPSISND